MTERYRGHGGWLQFESGQRFPVSSWRLASERGVAVVWTGALTLNAFDRDIPDGPAVATLLTLDDDPRTLVGRVKLTAISDQTHGISTRCEFEGLDDLRFDGERYQPVA